MATAEFTIEGLALHARHGALAGRARPRPALLPRPRDHRRDRRSRPSTDRLEDTLHYGQVIKAASAAFTAKSFNLIEAAAAAVGDALLAQFPKIERIRVTVHKPNAPVAALSTTSP